MAQQFEQSLQSPDIQQAPLNESVEAPGRGRRILAAAMVAGSVLAASACEGKVPFVGDSALITADVDSVVVLDTGGKKKKEAAPGDPAFRASGAMLVTYERVNGDTNLTTSLGSGGLVKDAEGNYSMVTVEHVARPLYDMPRTIENDGGPVKGATASSRETTPATLIPGIGLMKLDEKPIFTGKGNQPSGTDRPTDRASFIKLQGEQEEVIAEAEKQNQLRVAETAPLNPSFGDVLTMPLPETGERLPFVTISVTEDRAAADLVPLYLLDRGGDYEAGMQNLRRAIDQVRQSSNITTDEQAAGLVIGDLQEQLLRQVQNGEIAPQEAAKHLACMGDSGSVFQDEKQRVVGVLSSGNSFYLSGQSQDANAIYAISREAPEITRYCLSEITIAAVTQAGNGSK